MTAQPRRPRVVMLVMNHITGDSRVQKAAISMAEAGFDVTLLGRSRTDRQETTVLGDPATGQATVIRVPTGTAIATRRRQTWRRGLAGRIGFRSPEQETADRLEVRLRRAEDTARAATGTPPGLASRADLFLHRTTHAVRRRATRRHAQALAHPVPAAVRVRGLVFRVVRGGAWRRTLPHLLDWELAFGPVIDDLAPDLIHGHDVTTIGLAVRAAERARAAGRPCAAVYDAHEWIAGASAYTPERRTATLGLEREYIGRCDAVITVSDPIADLLHTTYHLRRRPAVVTNSPVLARTRVGADGTPSLRARIGLAPGVPLIVYSGWLAPERGVRTLIDALPQLDGVHGAVVAASENAHVKALQARATELGVADRFHVAPYVAPDDVAAYLSSADIGAITNLHEPNSELSLITKYGEYLHARLPIVVSDLKTMGDYTRHLGNGEVYPAGDSAAFAEAVRRVLSDPARYRAPYDNADLFREHSWERQAKILADVYRTALQSRDVPVPPPESLATNGSDAESGHETSAADGPIEATQGPSADAPSPSIAVQQSDAPSASARADGASVPAAHQATDRPSVSASLLIGPTNMAGQGWAWTRAAAHHLPGLRVEAAALDRPDSPLRFDADRRITPDQWTSTAWQAAERARITAEFTHVLLENGLAITGGRGGGRFLADAEAFTDAGLRVGLVFHGSEIRDPRRHRALYRDSPFADPNDPATAALQERHDELAAELEQFTGPVFVSTLDLLDFVPTATWLPVAVDTAAYTPGPEPLAHPGPPVVVHAPSRRSVKGSDAVDAAAQRLAEEGLITYRRIESVPPAEMPALIRSADIVIDQLAVGGYGVLAAQAMSAARCVIGNVNPRVRTRLLNALPIVQATPTATDGPSIAETLRTLIKDPDQIRTAAAAGPAFVSRHHEGTAAALVVAGFVARC